MTWRVKAELMLFGLKHDYFGYGTMVTKQKNGKYKVICDGELYLYTLHQLSEQWGTLEKDDQEQIILNYANECLY